MPKKKVAAASSKTKSQPPTTQPKPQPPSSATPTAPPLDLETQQRILDIYAAAFSNVLSCDSLPDLLQEIKQALFNREFATAFGRTDYLEAYAARWSPTRSLCYAAVFRELDGLFHQMMLQGAAKAEPLPSGEELHGPDGVNVGSETLSLRMLCVGGGPAEQVAFASLLKSILPTSSSSSSSLTLLDSGPWSSITSALQAHITTPPQLSPYASAAVKASNQAFIPPSHLSMKFEQHDVLGLSKDELTDLAGGGDLPVVVTMLFTLNELYNEGGIGKTTRYLGYLGECLASESLLLVVDSPGSYSEAAVGKEKKRYPMHWLLDHTLLEKSPAGARWEKLESKDSVWFRLPEQLSYPIQLENMRYQLHLYRLIKEATPYQ